MFRHLLQLIRLSATCVVDARDVAAAMIAAGERGRDGEKYIVGGSYATMAGALAGLERDLGARFRPLDETLRDVVAWYRTHPTGTATP
jgi:hypothetical protein